MNIGQVHENSLACATSLEFKPQLFELKHLKSLSFFNCFTSHHKHPVSIPTRNWEKLAERLESIEFRSNPGLTGPVPARIGSLVKLKSLVLIENGLTGQIPASIGNLVNLERLVLSGNKLTGQIPDSFCGLSNLLIFDLSGNSLSGPLPVTLGSLTSLLKLDLSHNLLEGNLPSEIQNMRHLTLLDLSNNKLSGGLANMSLGIGKLNSLEEMVLSNNPIGGELKSLELEKLEKLAILDLSNTGLSGEIPDSISVLKRLRFLGLSDNNLSGNLSPKLATMPSVGALYLNGNNLTGELNFSEWFYGKMGRRFGAWDNPNLCYSIGMSQSQANSNVPFGVKPCQPKVKLVEPNSEDHYLGVATGGGGGGDLNQDSHLVASLGLSSNGIDDGFWWLVSLELVLVMLFSFL